jgi:hypothetical protein
MRTAKIACHASACIACHTAPLRISDATGSTAVSGPSAGASWALMADRSHTPRGGALLLPSSGLLLRWGVRRCCCHQVLCLTCHRKCVCIICHLQVLLAQDGNKPSRGSRGGGVSHVGRQIFWAVVAGVCVCIICMAVG